MIRSRSNGLLFTLLLGGMTASVSPIMAAQRPAKTAAPAPAKAPAPAPAAAAAAPAPDAPINACDFFDPAEVSAVVGTDANQTAAPSRGSFASCGYTSANGDAVTISIADYGLAEVAQTFFDRGRDALKTAVVDESFGVPAYSNRTADQPPRITLAALKGTRTVTLEAAGPLATSMQGEPHLKVILTKAIAKLPAADPPPAPAPPQD